MLKLNVKNDCTVCLIQYTLIRAFHGQKINVYIFNEQRENQDKNVIEMETESENETDEIPAEEVI